MQPAPTAEPGKGAAYVPLRRASVSNRGSFHETGPQRPHRRKDPTQHDLWHPPFVGPWNQNAKSLCLRGLVFWAPTEAPQKRQLIVSIGTGISGNVPSLGSHAYVVAFSLPYSKGQGTELAVS